MCVGVPMRVMVAAQGWAWCNDGAGSVPEQIDTMLVGDVPEGTWLMTFLGAAREVMSETAARQSLAAIQALAALMRGEAVDLDAAFADLITHEPTWPDYPWQKAPPS